MTPAERRSVIRGLSQVFAPMGESEVDELLRAAGRATTPAGWGEQSDRIKQLMIRQHLAESTDAVLEALEELLLDIEPPQATADSDLDPSSIAKVERGIDGPIFVVHGHARAALHEAVRVLERGTGREVVVLHEQANAGRTILEKFEDYAADASFAVVLLTGDDEGGISASIDTHLRGRQNVIFRTRILFWEAWSAASRGAS